MKISHPLLLTFLVVTLAGRAVLAVPCPGTGAKLKVIINNPTSSSVQVTVSGRQVSGLATCTSQQDQYSKTVTLNPLQDMSFTLPDGGGFDTGLWLHHITALNGQYQSQKSVVLYTTDSNQYATVRWKYYPSVFTIITKGDPPGGTCTSTSCTFRQALAAASSATKPALVQFAIGPGNMAQTADLSVGLSVTIDGTNANGNPFVIGDALAVANEDPARIIDFKGVTNLSLSSSDNAMVKGLAINNTVASGNPTKQLISGTGNNVRLEALRLDGGEVGNCTPLNSAVEHLISIGGTGAVITKVEGHSAFGDGVFIDGVSHTVGDSWFHHNCTSNVEASNTTLVRNTIEFAGFRATDNVLVNDDASGVAGTGTSLITTSRNLVRNNARVGMEIPTTVLGLNLANDYVCGSYFSDGIVFTGVGPSTSATGTGLTTAYNYDHGLRFADTVSGTLTFNDNNAFTANDLCGLRNEAAVAVAANNNQWRDTNPSCVQSPDYCPPQAGEGAIVCNTIQPAPDVTIVIDPFIPASQSQPAYPTNAILQGQTVRVSGTGFNAIAGNPLAGAGVCTTNDVNDENCCRKKGKSNTCEVQPDPTDPPMPSQGNCVALMNKANQWTPLPVTSVTPTTIVAEIAEDPFICVGGNPPSEMVRVSKLSSGGQEIRGEEHYCWNKEPL